MTQERTLPMLQASYTKMTNDPIVCQDLRKYPYQKNSLGIVQVPRNKRRIENVYNIYINVHLLLVSESYHWETICVYMETNGG